MGKKQAREIRALLADKKIQRVYISEFPRTRETGEIVMQGRFAPFDVDPRINDRCSGFDSQPLVVFFDALDKSEDRLSAKFNYGESYYEEKERILSFIESMKASEFSDVLVVTHREPLRIIKGHFMGISDLECLKLDVANCEVFTVDI